MLWGRLADSSRFGRKTVLMIGLGGTSRSRHSAIGRFRSCNHCLTRPLSALLRWICLLDLFLASIVLQVSGRHHQWKCWCPSDHVRPNSAFSVYCAVMLTLSKDQRDCQRKEVPVQGLPVVAHDFQHRRHHRAYPRRNPLRSRADVSINLRRRRVLQALPLRRAEPSLGVLSPLRHDFHLALSGRG